MGWRPGLLIGFPYHANYKLAASIWQVPSLILCSSAGWCPIPTVPVIANYLRLQFYVNRKKIASLTIRRLFDESKGIEYKIEESGEIQFSIPCDTVMNISGMRIRFHENFEWGVLVMESHPTFTFLDMVQHTPQNGIPLSPGSTLTKET